MRPAEYKRIIEKKCRAAELFGPARNLERGRIAMKKKVMFALLLCALLAAGCAGEPEPGLFRAGRAGRPLPPARLRSLAA